MNRSINNILLAIVLVSTILMSGCISLRSPDTKDEHFREIPGPSRQTRLAQIHRWATAGAFSITKKGEKSVMANYFWLQEGKNQYRIRIVSALNLFSFTIKGLMHSVTMWKSVREHVTARSPEELLEKEMGWSIPISNMFYWMRGMAAPGPRDERFDKYGHLVALGQVGWKIQFFDYRNVKGFDLPSKLVMKHSGGFYVTIVMKRWRLINYSLPVE